MAISTNKVIKFCMKGFLVMGMLGQSFAAAPTYTETSDKAASQGAAASSSLIQLATNMKTPAIPPSENTGRAAKYGSILSNAKQVADCKFTEKGKWWDRRYGELPSDVANNPVTQDPEFCEFYQFSQDWFLYLISPSSFSGLANWEDQALFPLLKTKGTDSCVRQPQPETLAIPERINQAGGEYAIYDQDGDVVFYEISFSRNLCDYKAILAKPNFPGKTVELKMAWKVLNEGDKGDDYYQAKRIINGTSYNLGLVGWHIVVAADNHPEFVWITLDHKNNAVVCDEISGSQQASDFTSQACAQDNSQCNNLNKTLESTALKLPATLQPNDICQEFPYGTVEGHPITTNDGLNIALIKKLNSTQDAIFARSGLPPSLAVWKNYQFTGALWVSDIKKDSRDNEEEEEDDNQRGSLELANTVMETSSQGDSGKAGTALNCFGCHDYKGTASGKSNTKISSEGNGLSHIFHEIISGQP